MSRLNCLSSALLFLLPVPVAFAADASAPRDPLEALRRALEIPVVNYTNQDELQFRRRNLEKHIKALSPADLGPALRLQEWADQHGYEPVMAVDQAVREVAVKRLAALLHEVLQKGDTTDKRAALVQIGEMDFHRVNSGRALMASEFNSELIAALKDKDEVVCRTAAQRWKSPSAAQGGRRGPGEVACLRTGRPAPSRCRGTRRLVVERRGDKTRREVRRHRVEVRRPGSGSGSRGACGKSRSPR